MLDDLSANLASNVRRLREARGLTQQELSDASGVPRPTLAHLESGSANPTLGVLARVAVALGVSMEDFIRAPRAALVLQAASSLPCWERAGASGRELSSDAPGGLVVERIELSPRAVLERAAGRSHDRTYLACERGELDVSSGSEHELLRGGDVVVIAQGRAHVCTNRGRAAAVLYSVRVGTWSAA